MVGRSSDPSPEEIAEACERIRAGWPDAEAVKRLRVDWRGGEWAPAVVEGGEFDDCGLAEG